MECETELGLKERNGKAVLRGNHWKTTFNLLDIMNKFSSKEAKTIVVDLALFYSGTCSNHAVQIWIQSHFTNKKIDELVSNAFFCVNSWLL